MGCRGALSCKLDLAPEEEAAGQGACSALNGGCCPSLFRSPGTRTYPICLTPRPYSCRSTKIPRPHERDPDACFVLVARFMPYCATRYKVKLVGNPMRYAIWTTILPRLRSQVRVSFPAPKFPGPSMTSVVLVAHGLAIARFRIGSTTAAMATTRPPGSVRSMSRISRSSCPRSFRGEPNDPSPRQVGRDH
jgi:hypothetical protein